MDYQSPRLVDAVLKVRYDQIFEVAPLLTQQGCQLAGPPSIGPVQARLVDRVVAVEIILSASSPAQIRSRQPASLPRRHEAVELGLVSHFDGV